MILQKYLMWACGVFYTLSSGAFLNNEDDIPLYLSSATVIPWLERIDSLPLASGMPPFHPSELFLEAINKLGHRLVKKELIQQQWRVYP